MPPREWKLRLKDILESIAAIRDYVAGLELSSFASDPKTVDAVLHRFAIIGEAATQVPPDVASSHPEVPWRQMKAMRNIVVHAYFGVTLNIVWGTIQNDLEPLVPLLNKMLLE